MSLLDVLRGVMLDPAEQAAYNADPHAYLEQYGYDDVDPADLSEAFGLVADTLPPDQAQAAWPAAAEPDDSSFGTVTQDFDGDDGIDAPDVDPTDATGIDAPDIDVPAIDVPDVEVDAADADAEVDVPDIDGDDGPALSFGEGDDGAADIDDPTFDHTGGADLGGHGTDVDDIAGLTSGDDADADHDADSAFDDGFDHGGFDDDLSDGIGEGLGHDADHGHHDPDDDSGVALDDLDDNDPDDLDIGSF